VTDKRSDKMGSRLHQAGEELGQALVEPWTPEHKDFSFVRKADIDAKV